MSSVVIPAREVKAGDVIDFGGQPLTTDMEPYGVHKQDGVRHTYISWPLGGGWFPDDQPLTVTRPDPDAELVEVMARAICATYIKTSGAPDWDALVGDNIGGRDEYRREARAALTAARESGLL